MKKQGLKTKNIGKIKLNSSGITLIALVVTIIVLMILAGIVIATLMGDNGLVTRAREAKEKTDIAGEKEILYIAVLAAKSREKYGELNKDKLDDELYKYSEIKDTKQTEGGIIATFKSDRSYIVTFNGDVFSYEEITIENLVVKDEDELLIENCKSVTPQKALKINFEASISNGTITSINPNIEYTTDGSTSQKFIITGRTSSGLEITKEYIVDLKGYYNFPDLQVGDFVNYTLNTPTEAQLTQLNSDITTYSGATGNTTKIAEGNSLLCRVLEMDSNGNPTKLISADGVNTLKLYGADGYNNGVYLLNEMCSVLYSGNQGTTRSLTIEDLENYYFSSTTITSRNGYTPSGGVQYGRTKYYTGESLYPNIYYPNITLEEAGMGITTTIVDGKNTIRGEGLNISEQITTYTGYGHQNTENAPATNKGITVTQTYYEISQGNSRYKNSTLNNIMHKSPTSTSNTSNISTYWLASRCVQTTSNYAYFALRRVSSSKVEYRTLFTHNASSSYDTHKVRPIVILNSEIEAEYIGAYNSTYNLWNLITDDNRIKMMNTEHN